MAIRLIDRYPSRANPADADYPHGSGRNKSDPTADDGTPFDEDRFNDQEAFFQSLVEAAGITPSGVVDTVPQSDYVDALLAVARGVTDVDVGGSADVMLDTNDSRVAAIRAFNTLGADIAIEAPDAARYYLVINDTDGDFTLTFKTVNGAGVVVRQGNSLWVYSDGTDMRVIKSVADQENAGDPNGALAADTLYERAWDSSTSPPTLYVATAADGTVGGTTWESVGSGVSEVEPLTAASTDFFTPVNRSRQSEPDTTGDLWENAYKKVLDSANAYSGRVRPKQIIQLMNGYLLIYTGLESGIGSSTITGGLATSDDGYTWIDRGVFFDQLDQTWQGTRSNVQCVTWDPANKRWVLFVGGNDDSGSTPGKRAMGIFYSTDNFRTWTAYSGNPIITVDTADISDWGPGDPNSRVYANSVQVIDGTWYAFVSVGDDFNMAMGVLTASSPEGPWSGGAHNPVITGPSWIASAEKPDVHAYGPTFYDGKWWSVISSREARNKIGLASSTDFLNWTEETSTPIITLSDDSNGYVAGGVLMPFKSHWSILSGLRESDQGMILLNSHLHPFFL